MLLETATNDIMLFTPCLRGGLPQLPVQGKDFNLNAGGRDSLAVAEVSGVNLGRFSWKKRKAYVWDALPDQIRDFDGMIGPAVLGAQVVAFDFRAPRGFIGNSQMGSGGLNTPKHQLSGNFLSTVVSSLRTSG
jgi:hypothetical protein